jgi:hypothetical protein
VNNSGEGVEHKRGACYVICAYGRHESLRECQREQCLDFSKCNLESFSSLSSIPLLRLTVTARSATTATSMAQKLGTSSDKVHARNM